MLLPAMEDTIVAVSTGWSPSAVGVVRLSGSKAAELTVGLIERGGEGTADVEGLSAGRNAIVEARIEADEAGSIPAKLLVFRGPRSYTGQDVIEIHTVGCLPLLRALCARLIERGARRALPGEFTARAFRNGKLSADAVKQVSSLICAESQAGARAALRGAGGERERRIGATVDRLMRILGLVEAGIDFADEEGISFVSACEAREETAAALSEIEALWAEAGGEGGSAAAHVTLAGLANAGKSTLFNVLVGSERAIVSPIVGTTRDVITAEVEIGGRRVVIQDTAGLGDDEDSLSSASYVAAQRAAGAGDVVLWVHDGTRTFDGRELRMMEGVEEERRVVVLTKADRAGRAGGCGAPGGGVDESGVVKGECITVCAWTGSGIDALRASICRRLDRTAVAVGETTCQAALHEASDALVRAVELIPETDGPPRSGELLAAELRVALAALDPWRRVPDPEEVLGRIFSQFCIGK